MEPQRTQWTQRRKSPVGQAVPAAFDRARFRRIAKGVRLPRSDGSVREPGGRRMPAAEQSVPAVSGSAGHSRAIPRQAQPALPDLSTEMTPVPFISAFLFPPLCVLRALCGFFVFSPRGRVEPQRTQWTQRRKSPLGQAVPAAFDRAEIPSHCKRLCLPPLMREIPSHCKGGSPATI